MENGHNHVSTINILALCIRNDCNLHYITKKRMRILKREHSSSDGFLAFIAAKFPDVTALVLVSPARRNFSLSLEPRSDET